MLFLLFLIGTSYAACDVSLTLCDTCDDQAGAAQACLTCKAMNYLNAETPARCVANSTGCKEQTDANTCKTCADGATADSGAATCSCPVGNVLKTDGTACQACKADCNVCSADTNTCTTCADGFSQAGKTDGTCTECNAACATCATADVNQCLTCPAGKGLAGTTSCVACTGDGATGGANAGCATCEFAAGECSACKAGFFNSVSANDGTAGKPVTCTACEKSCATCTDGTTCASCDKGKALDNNLCVACTTEGCVCDAGKDTCTECLDGYTFVAAEGGNAATCKKDAPASSAAALGMSIIAGVAALL